MDTQEETLPVTTDVPTEADYIADSADLYTGSQTSPDKKARIYTAFDALQLRPGEIARRLNMDRRTVAAVLMAREHDAIEARNYLAANGLQFAKDWIRASETGASKGRHLPAKDALLHLKVIEPIEDTRPSVNLMVCIGTPGVPLSLPNPLQVIKTQAVTETERTST